MKHWPKTARDACEIDHLLKVIPADLGCELYEALNNATLTGKVMTTPVAKALARYEREVGS